MVRECFRLLRLLSFTSSLVQETREENKYNKKILFISLPVGLGLPLALHTRLTLAPDLTVISPLSGSDCTVGGTRD